MTATAAAPGADRLERPLRFITAASLFDGHDAAINIMRRILQQQGAEVIHLGHTSRASPLRVELYKGLGLARYFRQRAHGLGEAVAAWLLWPLVVGAAVARPLLWRLTGRANAL